MVILLSAHVTECLLQSSSQCCIASCCWMVIIQQPSDATLMGTLHGLLCGELHCAAILLWLCRGNEVCDDSGRILQEARPNIS